MSLNLYTYCENDPINFLDPTGHYPEMVSYNPNRYSNTVVYLQQELNKHGYGLDADGYFGKYTLAAVKDYQRHHNLEVDGIVGPQTWGSLLRGSASTSQSTPTTTSRTNSGSNSSGGLVKYNPNSYNPEAARVQQILNNKGANLVVDGYFGNNTLAAVRQFQRANGLDDDGIVGTKTWGMLLSRSSVYYGGSRSGRNNSRPVVEPGDGAGSTDVDIMYTKEEAYKYINGGTWGLYSSRIDDISMLPQIICYKDSDYTYVYALVQATTESMGITMKIPNGYEYRRIYSDGPKVFTGTLPIMPGGIKWSGKANSWNTKGTWGEESLQKHFEKHGKEVGAESVEQYLRKAEAFKQNLKGAKTSKIDGAVDGVIRYKKLGKYIDLAPDGTIVSFGKQ